MTASSDLLIEIGVDYETFIFCNAARCLQSTVVFAAAPEVNTMVELNAMNGTGYGGSDSDDRYTVTGGGVTVDYRPYGLIDMNGEPTAMETVIY